MFFVIQTIAKMKGDKISTSASIVSKHTTRSNAIAAIAKYTKSSMADISVGATRTDTINKDEGANVMLAALYDGAVKKTVVHFQVQEF